MVHVPFLHEQKLELQVLGVKSACHVETSEQVGPKVVTVQSSANCPAAVEAIIKKKAANSIPEKEGEKVSDKRTLTRQGYKEQPTDNAEKKLKPKTHLNPARKESKCRM